MIGPLSGYRGIVLTQAWAGSYATQLLGMLGAEIIQVEFHGRPDSWRGAYDRPIPDTVTSAQGAAEDQHPWNVNPLYNAVNLNKQCITLDLTHPDGIEIFKRLVPLADFVAENFAPRVLGNLGILHMGQGRMDQARKYYEVALVLLREVGDRRGEGNILGFLGTLLMDQGRMDQARECLEAALVVLRAQQRET